jgi:phosphoribosylformylglycinamidine (FGAM) synthase-like amidotransferase family enzyme
MPHPERASEGLLGSADGRLIFEGLVKWIEQKGQAAPALRG